jgi:hypothetical protein
MSVETIRKMLEERKKERNERLLEEAKRRDEQNTEWNRKKELDEVRQNERRH